jgi:hypothetical protein
MKRARKTPLIQHPWTDLMTVYWQNEPPLFNAWKLYKRDDITEESRAELLAMLHSHELARDDTSEIDPYINNFRYVFDKENLFRLLAEMAPAMRHPNARQRLESELEYVWSAIDQM